MEFIAAIIKIPAKTSKIFITMIFAVLEPNI